MLYNLNVGKLEALQELPHHYSDHNIFPPRFLAFQTLPDVFYVL